MISYKEISNTIENIIKNDQTARVYYNDMISKSKLGELGKNGEIHPFITYILSKVKQIHGNIEIKELKRGIIHFYSKNFLGIDVDLW
jgi:hypothetical protein